MLTGETNQGVMSQITGMQIDMEFSQVSRYMQMHGYPGADAGGVMMAEKVRDNFLRYLAEHKTPLPSVTALEVNLVIAAHVSPLLYRNIAVFARNNLPNLSDLYLECSSHILCESGNLYCCPKHMLTMSCTAGMTMLASLRCPQRKNLRRLTISSRGGPIDLPCHVERLPSLCELGLSNVTVGPITLHPENKGLTTLHLSHLTTSAAYLVSLIMQGSASALPSGATGFRRQSRVSELVLNYVNLDGFLCDGEVKGSYPLFPWHTYFTHFFKSNLPGPPGPPPFRPEPFPFSTTTLHHRPSYPKSKLCANKTKYSTDPGTWRDVFHIIRNYCPHLKYLRVVFCSYVRRAGAHSGDEMMKHINDANSLQMLVNNVSSRPGGKATGVIMEPNNSPGHSF